jgi:hypothetical protein
VVDSCGHGNEASSTIKCVEFLDSLDVLSSSHDICSISCNGLVKIALNRWVCAATVPRLLGATWQSAARWGSRHLVVITDRLGQAVLQAGYRCCHGKSRRSEGDISLTANDNTVLSSIYCFTFLIYDTVVSDALYTPLDFHYHKYNLDQRGSSQGKNWIQQCLHDLLRPEILLVQYWNLKMWKHYARKRPMVCVRRQQAMDFCCLKQVRNKLLKPPAWEGSVHPIIVAFTMGRTVISYR